MEPEKQEKFFFHGRKKKKKQKNFNKNVSKYPEIVFSKSQCIINNA